MALSGQRKDSLRCESWTQQQSGLRPALRLSARGWARTRSADMWLQTHFAGRLKHAPLQWWGLTVSGGLPWWGCHQKRQPPRSDGRAFRAVPGDTWAEISHVCAAERLLADSASYFTRNYEALAVFFLAPGNKRFRTAKTSYNLLPRVLSGWEISIKRWGMRRSVSLTSWGKHILLLFPYL